MEIETHYTLKLTEDELSALKRFIGATSPDEREKKGLTKEQAQLLSEIWGALPHVDDDDD